MRLAHRIPDELGRHDHGKKPHEASKGSAEASTGNALRAAATTTAMTVMVVRAGYS